MVGREGAERAVAGLDGEQLYGRNVRVNEAQKREQRAPRPRRTFEEVDFSNFNANGEYLFFSSLLKACSQIASFHF